MSMLPTRTTFVAFATAALSLAAVPAAVADPACADPVASALHEVHETTGDPAGLVHEAEETYCGVKP